ncbi:putative carboxylesterase type B [Caballeronia glathei]|uniref:Carboxylic ester hydrolase n=1 Tax=Caballeronia glathei TaxID=60547 RepID=A0A069PM86_9BURK|nr:carboxylesterase/lipase family protein [Caballeronia glathei]KDR38411.1 carboxylesterase [Caballeronia glathei]CDY74228.1 putative carboxylesterase type B [Caballeronia glathei]
MKARTSESAGVASLSDPKRRVALKGLAATTAGAILPALNSCAFTSSATSPVVETRAGKLRGTNVSGVEVFKGVRYADTTAATNRFMPPQPVPPWAGVKDATAFGASAPQTSDSLTALNSWYSQLQPLCEDCLFLNLFAPASGRASARRPVMVWLHGGSWSNCAGTAPGFNGTNLARDGDVVVVTVNHRLNVFGYLYLGDKDPRFADSANAGLFDVVASLAWVRDNIAAFGGDPGNVTVFGQSGGAAKVAALMDFAPAHGLFHKAVIESCSGGIHLESREEAEGQARLLGARLGIPDLDPGKLQAVPMGRMIAAMKTISDPFRPVVDGRGFTRHPFDPGAPARSSGMPLLVGNAANEMTLYMAADPRNFSLDVNEVKKRTGLLLKQDPASAARIVDAYRAAQPNASPSQLLAALSTDYVFRRNTTRIAELQSAHAPVYDYVFDWKTPVMGGNLQSPHTAEVPFVFGTVDVASGLLGNGAELAGLSRDVMGTWTAFARTGNPNTSAMPAWAPYDTARRSTMMIDVQSHVASDPGGTARHALDGLPLYEYNVDRNSVVRSTGA